MVTNIDYVKLLNTYSKISKVFGFRSFTANDYKNIISYNEYGASDIYESMTTLKDHKIIKLVKTEYFIIPSNNENYLIYKYNDKVISKQTYDELKSLNIDNLTCENGIKCRRNYYQINKDTYFHIVYLINQRIKYNTNCITSLSNQIKDLENTNAQLTKLVDNF